MREGNCITIGKQRSNSGTFPNSRKNLDTDRKGQMGNKRGNPAWVRGKSGNPHGRPIGQTKLASYHREPDLFTVRHLRWLRFSLEYIVAMGNGAKAARLAGYSPKSARFIASRLIRNAAVRAIMREIAGRYHLGRWGQ